MEKALLVQRFTLLHDGSIQSWQVAYLSFQIAARLGAILDVLIIDQGTASPEFTSQISEIEVGARAAGVEVSTHLIADRTPSTLKKAIRRTNSLLVPANMVPDGASVKDLLEIVSCPIWILSKDIAVRKLALIADGSDREENSLRYVTALSQRLQNPLTILIQSNRSPIVESREGLLTWFPISNFSIGEITSALGKIDPSLFFIPDSLINLIGQFVVNCVIYPAGGSA